VKALVLCAGFGSRLGDLCRERPKPLLPIDGRTIVEHILDGIASAGVTDVWINLHHHADQFPRTLGDGARFGVRLHYLVEAEPLGTAGTVASVRGEIGDEPLLVHYGDILTDHDLAGLVRSHGHTSAWATLLVHQRAGSNSVAVFGDGARITMFLERPAATPKDVEPWAFSGICVLSPEAMACIPASMPADLPAHVFPALAERGRLYGQRLHGFRCAIDSPQRLEIARRACASGAFVPAARRRP
jgi:NDP-sugar pyrophosphorylase family protein